MATGLYRRILVPIEGTHSDHPVLEHVRELAPIHASEVVLLRVAHFHTRDGRAYEMHDAEDDLQRAADALRGHGFEVSTVLRSGEPADTICATADELGVDLIAMATHGHGWLQRAVLGSVSEAVRHHCDVPLLLVKHLE